MDLALGFVKRLQRIGGDDRRENEWHDEPHRIPSWDPQFQLANMAHRPWFPKVGNFDHFALFANHQHFNSLDHNRLSVKPMIAKGLQFRMNNAKLSHA